MSEPTRVILDCDPGNGFTAAGIDDGFALATAAGYPEVLELDAITVVSGNTDVEEGAASALSIVELLGRQIPVFRGAARPLAGSAEPWRSSRLARRRGDLARRLWADVPPPAPSTPPGEGAAADRIVQTAMDTSRGIVIVALGPLTNIAHALEIEPRIRDRIQRVVVMGGAFDPSRAQPEFNFGFDPEAASRVIGSGLPVTLVPYEVGASTTLSQRDLDGLGSTPLADYLVATARPWIEWVEQHLKQPGAHLHDVIPVALLIDPGIVSSERARIGVGCTPAARRGVSYLVQGESEGFPVDLVHAVDQQRLLQIVRRGIERAGLHQERADNGNDQ